MIQPKVQYAILIAAIVIAGGVTYSVLRPAARRDAASAVQVAQGDHYFCDQCRKEFTIKSADWAKMVMDQETIAKDPTASRRPPCPLCGARHSGWMMIQCPQCGKYFLPAGMGPGPARGQPDVCPYCKTDRGQWYKAKQGQ